MKEIELRVLGGVVTRTVNGVSETFEYSFGVEDETEERCDLCKEEYTPSFFCEDCSERGVASRVCNGCCRC